MYSIYNNNAPKDFPYKVQLIYWTNLKEDEINLNPEYEESLTQFE